ncbi:MAG: HD domain-containing protein [Flavobacteriaceae bacterium]|nr:HD domain-containing protein [Bacteroidia bacterium]MBT8287960.1 HD domain-containing protein [Bacteroidia bacterium]NNF74443.1 HD domain-containing protein [Flavobacteriaceae bacterium]NNK73638.1 HD domain-containing protein [Flavobacteriaceae bacterium]
MENIVRASENYVTNTLVEILSSDFLYHNLSHTKRVVKKTKELIEGEKVQEDDAFHLMIAAWFHDIGYTKDPDQHEVRSAEMAEEFLNGEKLDQSSIDKVKSLIMATVMEYEPKNKLEMIIRDADCAHFASKNYEDISGLLRGELELIKNKVLTDKEWIDENINFFKDVQRFYTDYALDNWQKGKEKNLAWLLRRQKKLGFDHSKLKQKKAELDFKKNKAALPERGIETMFRVTLKNHITLSDIADTKANILLSVNAIIVSLVLSNLIPKLDNPSNAYLIYPTVIFTLFTVIAMILSVIATRPNVTSGKFTKEDVEKKKVNLIFFGNFHKMSLDDFEWAMGEMMQDRDYLYSSMKKDLYFLGKVLNRKYKILRITYTVFIIGIIISVLAFAVAFQYSGA